MSDIIVDVDYKAILKKMGLGESTEAQKHLADTVERLSRLYVPMSEGSGAHMVGKTRVTKDSIIYEGPYAHYQYVGIVRAGRAPKQPTGEELTYNDSPMRGKEWDKRMMADRSDEVEKDLENYMKGRL
ncbi:minor capsid protein [Chakrabartyella piscis]|uniref:minor capsid protein n=1 Tax=Chakrabartyella piscis TaxID=2918914 RepID=UPI0029587B68|nr:minor capsid protein [Chakrabartyella piscis]